MLAPHDSKLVDRYSTSTQCICIPYVAQYSSHGAQTPGPSLLRLHVTLGWPSSTVVPYLTENICAICTESLSNSSITHGAAPLGTQTRTRTLLQLTASALDRHPQQCTPGSDQTLRIQWQFFLIHQSSLNVWSVWPCLISKASGHIRTRTLLGAADSNPINFGPEPPVAPDGSAGSGSTGAYLRTAYILRSVPVCYFRELACCSLPAHLGIDKGWY